MAFLEFEIFMLHLKCINHICVQNYIFNHSSCFILKIGKSKVNKNLPAGISGQSGVENSILVDEDNLETLESSLGTEETSRCRLVFFFFKISSSLFTFHYENIFRQFVHFKIFLFSTVISSLTFPLHEHPDIPSLLEGFSLLNLTVVHHFTYKLYLISS